MACVTHLVRVLERTHKINPEVAGSNPVTSHPKYITSLLITDYLQIFKSMI